MLFSENALEFLAPQSKITSVFGGGTCCLEDWMVESNMDASPLGISQVPFQLIVHCPSLNWYIEF